jgi:hypothetical protein
MIRKKKKKRKELETYNGHFLKNIQYVVLLVEKYQLHCHGNKNRNNEKIYRDVWKFVYRYFSFSKIVID